MKKVSPGIYNAEMDSKYFHLYLAYLKLKRMKRATIKYSNLIAKFEFEYYRTSKMNRMLNDYNKNNDVLFAYIEPIMWKKRVDAGVKILGITPYEELSKRDEEFIMV